MVTTPIAPWVFALGVADDVDKVFMFIRVTLQEKEKLLAYQLKGVAQVWINQWKEEGG